MTVMTMLEAIRWTLAHELERDERTILLGQDIGKLGGVFRATDGLQERFGPARVVDMPLAEGAIVGAALGLAISGLVPVAEIQFMGFTAQAFHQIVPQLARYRWRSGGRYGAQVTIRAPYGGRVGTPELHSDSLESLYAHCPGLKVVAPATPADAKGLLLEAIRDPDPVLFCEPLRGYRLVKGEVPDDDNATPFGKLRLAREGGDVTLVAWSAAVHVAEEAAGLLLGDGIGASVVDLRTLVPLDEDGLLAAVEATGRCVVVHEAPLTGGFGAELVATIQEHGFFSLEAPIVRVTAPDAPYPLAKLEHRYVPSAELVAGAVRKLLAN